MTELPLPRRGARMPGWLPWTVLSVLLALGAAGWASGPVDVHEFPTAEMEARYRALIDEFRCPKCLNTNLSGSDAPIAQDLRATVHRLLVEEGLEDQAVRDYLQARYGDFVLYDPPFKPGTWILWIAPVVFLALGLWVLARVLRSGREVTLEAADRARLEQILKEQDVL